MENTLQITKATIDDIEILLLISQKTFYDTFADDNSQENMQLYLDQNITHPKLREEISNPYSEFYLAKIDNRTIGYLKVNFGPAQTELKDPKALEIERIYVTKDYFGQNIGQSLYNKAIAIAKEHQLLYIWLGVWEENKRAIGFYTKNGFVAFDKHTFVMGNDKQTDIMMKLELQ
ncbi:GNAT family N-acetyltransferase [Flavobacterium humi]|uniref:GNAT family N-acetyltransferase n=1 Tax=Flavobacterium humi TaxID=2562683 RepID=A0A4Z0L3J5_9FLAO|nr:GNAT family N-acetyltransferase [Flavobacterium humi]TGD56800.1 GNAT family N-acetyltransferase [Flavobacterium humi]